MKLTGNIIANLYWKNGRKIDKSIVEIVIKNLYKLIEDFNSLEKISQELDYEMSDKEKQEYYDNYIDLEDENEVEKELEKEVEK